MAKSKGAKEGDEALREELKAGDTVYTPKNCELWFSTQVSEIL